MFLTVYGTFSAVSQVLRSIWPRTARTPASQTMPHGFCITAVSQLRSDPWNLISDVDVRIPKMMPTRQTKKRVNLDGSLKMQWGRVDMEIRNLRPWTHDPPAVQVIERQREHSRRIQIGLRPSRPQARSPRSPPRRRSACGQDLAPSSIGDAGLLAALGLDISGRRDTRVGDMTGLVPLAIRQRHRLSTSSATALEYVRLAPYGTAVTGDSRSGSQPADPDAAAPNGDINREERPGRRVARPRRRSSLGSTFGEDVTGDGRRRA